MTNIPESDWKYLRSVKGELLETLCKQINDEASRIIKAPSLSQHEKFLHLFRHVMEKNEIIANCFDDWRRSNILLKVVSLRKQQLLTDKYITRLSEETRSKINWM
jgi:hypothetical protein